MSYLAQKVHLYEISFIFQMSSTHLKSVYDPNKTILAIPYREVPQMFHAKYQRDRPSGSREEIVQWFN